jgi:hypothetical protein
MKVFDMTKHPRFGGRTQEPTEEDEIPRGRVSFMETVLTLRDESWPTKQVISARVMKPENAEARREIAEDLLAVLSGIRYEEHRVMAGPTGIVPEGSSPLGRVHPEILALAYPLWDAYFCAGIPNNGYFDFEVNGCPYEMGDIDNFPPSNWDRQLRDGPWMDEPA